MLVKIFLANVERTCFGPILIWLFPFYNVKFCPNLVKIFF